MKPNLYRIVTECVERGVRYGYNRAYKHTKKPGEDEVVQQIIQAVINEVCEYFTFEEE